MIEEAIWLFRQYPKTTLLYADNVVKILEDLARGDSRELLYNEKSAEESAKNGV